MLNHDYFGEITNLTDILWQKYLMIDKMPIAVNLVNNCKISPTSDGLNRYAFACQHLADFDSNNRHQFVVAILRKNDAFLEKYIDEISYYHWKFTPNFDENYLDNDISNYTQNPKRLVLQNIVIYFEGNETDGFIQFNYKVYADLPNEILWIKTDLTGSILNSVWENPNA